MDARSPSFKVVSWVLRVYSRRQRKTTAVKSSLAPDAREQGTVLSLGGHGTNQSTVSDYRDKKAGRVPTALELSLVAKTDAGCVLL